MTTQIEQVKKREEVPSTDQWNVSALYQGPDEWERDWITLKGEAHAPHWPNLLVFKGRFMEGSSILKEALDLYFNLSRSLEKLYTYAHLRHDEEITEDRHKQFFQKISSLLFDLQQEASWIEPEILALPEEKIEEYLNDPRLKEYRIYLEKIIHMRPHTLSSEKEELLAMAGKSLQTPPKAFSALNNADIKLGVIKDESGKEHPLSHGLYQLYLRSSDRVLRENAFKGLHGKYFEYENTMAELLYGEVQSHIFNARARKFSSSLEAALFPKKIPLTVYQSLIATVRESLPSLHRYIALRKKILNLGEIHLYDMYVPLVPQIDMCMGYDEAEEIVIHSAAPLGKEYQTVLRKGLKVDRWVDRYENKNKRSGAYSSGCYDSFPYILMNYRGILRDVFTLAHEAGHSMHTYLSNQAQSYPYSRYPIFVAEVASTFNEELLMHHLLQKRVKKEEKLFLINEKIEDIRATFFRQTLFAEFELKIHELVEENVPLTPTLLKNIYLQLNKDYFGEETVVDSEIAIEWARIPHFYYNFYVYQYATGISAALDLAERVLNQDSKARDSYLNFLKGGSSLFPIELLQVAGIDISSSDPIRATVRKFDSLVNNLEQLALN